MNNYIEINEAQWQRAVHCAVFRDCVEPSYCVTFEVDVTELRNFAKKNGLSFTMAMVYAACKCANDVEAFRYRFLDGKVVLFDQVDTAFTYLNKETNLFKVVNVPMIEDIVEYCARAKEMADNQEAYFTGPLGIDVYQCSPMLWIKYSHISHTNSGKKDNATPLFDWGRFYEKDGRWLMPFSVQVHHSFVDGVHVGEFAEKLENFLNAPR
ncbi:MAG: chloramphenicol acetyltransferase [Bacteroidaceae bacterium]|nr:chloramphenicol acetyltransferase [Bacteroidaceae bacterium]